MNLLVTNTHAPQSYDIIRALRPFANKIVATMEGESRLKARLSPGANSLLVDKRYYTPAPVEDWAAGKISQENTPLEESFVQTLLQICEKEQITVIYPTWDPYVYVLSKNLARFQKLGVTIPVPEFETAINALDKYRTVQAAQAVGFPCPRTYLYDETLDLKAIAEKEGFPLVIKPRFTSGSRGTLIVKTYDELIAKLPKVVKDHNNPLIQEYIPGGIVTSVQFVVDRQGEIKFSFHKKKVRKLRLTSRYCTVSETFPLEQYAIDMRKIVKQVGWYGAMGIETMIDPRDGVQKLMEMNARYPRQLWNRLELGINEPLMCLKIAQGQEVEAIKDYPLGVLFVCPVDDIQLLGLEILDRLLYKFRTGIQGQEPLDNLSAPNPIIKQVQFFLQTYKSNKQKLIDPYTKYFFHDPLVSMLWWLQFATWMVGGLKKIGK
ncbi:MAG: ATP-grasp domain-containing protein [Blastocatellia bacterium]